MSVIKKSKTLTDHLSEEEFKILSALATPQAIQNYLEKLDFNHEESGETCMSPRRVLQEQKAHCLEGGMLAALALSIQGRTPYIMSIKVTQDDYDHVVALYQEHGYWGALSKTNHAVLGFRDPVYKTIRELAMSYFHEYFLIKNGKKTMRGYTQPLSMRRFGTLWTTQETDLFHIAYALSDHDYISVIPEEQEKLLRRATPHERTRANISLDNL